MKPLPQEPGIFFGRRSTRSQNASSSRSADWGDPTAPGPRGVGVRRFVVKKKKDGAPASLGVFLVPYAIYGPYLRVMLVFLGGTSLLWLHSTPIPKITTSTNPRNPKWCMRCNTAALLTFLFFFLRARSARRAVSRASGASWRHKPRGKFVARGDRSGVSEVPKLDR